MNHKLTADLHDVLTLNDSLTAQNARLQAVNTTLREQLSTMPEPRILEEEAIG